MIDRPEWQTDTAGRNCRAHSIYSSPSLPLPTLLTYAINKEKRMYQMYSLVKFYKCELLSHSSHRKRLIEYLTFSSCQLHTSCKFHNTLRACLASPQLYSWSSCVWCVYLWIVPSRWSWGLFGCEYYRFLFCYCFWVSPFPSSDEMNPGACILFRSFMVRAVPNTGCSWTWPRPYIFS